MNVSVQIQFRDRMREYTNANLLRASSNSVFLDELNVPFTGVVCEDGEVEIFDVDGGILVLARQRNLIAGQSIRIIFDGMQMCDAVVERWEFNFSSNIARVSIKSSLLEWDDRNLETITLREHSNALVLFNIINAASGNIVREVGGGAINASSPIGSHLASIPIRYLARDSSTLRQAWNDLCDLAGLIIFKQPNGVVGAVRAYG